MAKCPKNGNVCHSAMAWHITASRTSAQQQNSAKHELLNPLQKCRKCWNEKIRNKI